MVKPVKSTMNKSTLLDSIADVLDEEYENYDFPSKKVAKTVIEHLENLMQGSVCPKGCGEFMMPGMFKITLRKVKAVKKGTPVRNPATGEMIKSKGKPASVRVKLRALSKLKKAAI